MYLKDMFFSVPKMYNFSQAQASFLMKIGVNWMATFQNIHSGVKINIGKERYQSQKQFKGIILGRGWDKFQILVI